MLCYELTSFKKYLVEEYLNQNVFIQTAVNDVIEEFNDIEQKLIRQLNKEGLKNKEDELSKDFSLIVTHIEETIYRQKFEGAACGFYNANIIARDLGLQDKVKNEIDIKKGGLDKKEEEETYEP